MPTATDYTKPIMLAQNWPASWENINLHPYRCDFLADQVAVDFISQEMQTPARALWLLGDGDLCWWGQSALLEMDGVDSNWVDYLSLTSGLYPSDRKLLWEPMDAALRNARTWMMQYRWEVAERFCVMALRANGVIPDPLTHTFRYRGEVKCKADCNAMYRLSQYGAWWPLLANRKIAIVGGHAERLKERLLNPAFVAASGGAEISWTIPHTLTCPPLTLPKAPAYFQLCDQLGSTDWDLLLCSAGGLAILLCDFAQRIGRNALDIGSLDVGLPSGGLFTAWESFHGPVGKDGSGEV